MAKFIKVIIPKKTEIFSVSAIVKDRHIIGHGNGAKVILPKELIGKECIVLVR